ncbi:MAG: T9SS type A sorting domain-containing protein, partial [Bacteroidales bacterium]|nr:T9SS type A sorting domain-containing protein [Bacteroidales bacterium]
AARDTIWVTFYQRPVAFAGEDDAVCGNQYGLLAELSIPESPNYTPLMQWGIAGHPSGESADISSINVAQTTLTVTSSGMWEVTLTERNSLLSSCYSRDTAIIEFVEIPVVNAGPDKDVCGNCTTLDGTTGGFGGSWLANGSNFVDYYAGNTEVCVASYGSRTFTWIETNSAITSSQNCSSTDDVVITFWRQPTAVILTDEADSVACGLTFDNLRAENPGSGVTGRWWNENPASTYQDEFDFYTSVTVPSYGYHDFYWIEETGPMLMPGFCTDTAGPLTIHFLNEHPIHAGFDRDVFGYECQLEGSSVCETDPYTSCYYLWVTYGAIVEDVNSLQTSLSVSEYGEYTFILVSEYMNMQGCTDNDTVKINFRDPIEFGVDETEKYDFEIFPNPTSGLFTLQSEHRIESIIITAINGKEVMQIDSPQSVIDISNLDQGIYIIKIAIFEGLIVLKIVKH